MDPVLDPEQLDGRRQQVQPRQIGKTGPSNDPFDQSLIEIETSLSLQRIVKNLKSRVPPSSHMFAPSIRPHEPDARIGLRVKINDQHFLFMKLSECCPNVNHCGGLPNAA